MKRKKYGVKNIAELRALDNVNKALMNITGLKRPGYALKKYMDRVSRIYRYDTDVLEKYLAVYTSWQNYLSEQCIIMDIIRTAAESQRSFFYSEAVKNADGVNITERKVIAESDANYKLADGIYNEVGNGFNILNMQYENCDRAYKLVSRILTKRLGVKEW